MSNRATLGWKWANALLLSLFATLAVSSPALASSAQDGHTDFLPEILTFLFLASLAHLAGSFMERIGQSAVIGYLITGIVIGNIGCTAPMTNQPLIERAAFGGVLVLMFLVGLETHLGEMRRSGWPALRVATVGVITPMTLSLWVMPILDPGKPVITYWWYAAATAATSVGITSVVLKDLGMIRTSLGVIIIGAAVLDDVMGLGVLSVVSSVAKEGKIDFLAAGWIVGKAVLFLVGGVLLGAWLANPLSWFFSKFLPRSNGKLLFALSFGGGFAWLASLLGLEPIIGAFTGGLVLNDVHFGRFESERHVEDLIKPWSYIVMPTFFLTTGAKVPIQALGNPAIWGAVAALTGIAVIGKLVCGSAAWRELGSRGALGVGVGMVPRGEVGIVFANLGLTLAVISGDGFATILAMVLITTLCAPPTLKVVLKGYCEQRTVSNPDEQQVAETLV